MDRLCLGVVDDQILELLDEYPQGLTLAEISWLFEKDMAREVQRLFDMGVLERMPVGTFRTLGRGDEWG